MEAVDAVIRSVREVGQETVAIDVETPEGFAPRPGQFVLVRATIDGEEHARHYTMSSPNAQGAFEITVGIDPDGTLSGWLADRVPGDTLEIQGPYGTIFYDDEPTVTVIAGGPGIGAGLGVLERAIQEGHTGGLIALVDGGVPHEPRLAALAAGDLDVYLCRSDDGVRTAVRSLTDLQPTGQVFVFGFRSFIDVVVDTLESLGIDPGDAKIENYG